MLITWNNAICRILGTVPNKRAKRKRDYGKNKRYFCRANKKKSWFLLLPYKPAVKIFWVFHKEPDFLPFMQYQQYQPKREQQQQKKWIWNKNGTRQCTRAVWSPFADIHSTHPTALGLLEFPVRICDISHITTHTRPILFILWLRSLKTSGLSITFGNLNSACRSFEAEGFILNHLPPLSCTFTECVT